MEWQIVVFVLQILLLAISYFLFQQARAELAARAAETPVLSEVRALQRTVKQLLSEIETAADQTSARLESRTAEARDLLQSLDRRLEALRTDESSQTTARTRSKRSQSVAPEPAIMQGIAVTTYNSKAESGNTDALSVRHTRRQTVYELADAGETSASIAQATGLSEGEVETLLGLRLQRQ